MATKEEKQKIINDMFQEIFKVTQNEKVAGSATGDIKAVIDEGKWFIKVPGVCTIAIKADYEEMDIEPEKEEAGVPINDEGNVGFNAPIRKPRPMGDDFINSIARDYE